MVIKVIHIDDDTQFWWARGESAKVVRAMCGETAIISKDGDILPRKFDFVLSMYGERATCEECKARLARAR